MKYVDKRYVQLCLPDLISIFDKLYFVVRVESKGRGRFDQNSWLRLTPAKYDGTSHERARNDMVLLRNRDNLLAW